MEPTISPLQSICLTQFLYLWRKHHITHLHQSKAPSIQTKEHGRDLQYNLKDMNLPPLIHRWAKVAINHKMSSQSSALKTEVLSMDQIILSQPDRKDAYNGMVLEETWYFQIKN